MSPAGRLVFPAGFRRRRSPRESLLLKLAAGFALLAMALVFSSGWHGAFVQLQSYTGHLPAIFWESLTALGDERMVLAFVLPFCVRYPRLLWGIVVASLMGALLSRGLKVWFDLPRPAAVLAPELITIIGRRVTAHSFPSGHTISAFTFLGVWLAMCPRRRVWPWLLLASSVGLSRVAVGAHWPIDVLTGALIGLCAAWAAMPVVRWLAPKVAGRISTGLFGFVIVAVLTLPFDGQGYPGSFAVRLLFCLGGVGLALLACQGRIRLRRGEPGPSAAEAEADGPAAR